MYSLQKLNKLILYYFSTYIFDDNFALDCGPGTDYLWIQYIWKNARKNRCYNERGSRTNCVRSSIPHCILECYALSTGSYRRFGNCHYFVFGIKHSKKNLLRLSTLNVTWVTIVTSWNGTSE